MELGYRNVWTMSDRLSVEKLKRHCQQLQVNSESFRKDLLKRPELWHRVSMFAPDLIGVNLVYETGVPTIEILFPIIVGRMKLFIDGVSGELRVPHANRLVRNTFAHLLSLDDAIRAVDTALVNLVVFSQLMLDDPYLGCVCRSLGGVNRV